LLTSQAASGDFIQNQSASPQTADFNISGTGVADTLEANTIDRATTGTLNIGTVNATWISLGASVSWWSGAARSLSIAPESSGAGDQLTIAAGDGATGSTGGDLLLEAGANGTANGTPGSVIVKANGGDSTTAFQVQDAGGNAVLGVDTTTDTVTINGNVNTASGYGFSVGSASGIDAGCGASSVLTGQTVTGGIVVSGACGVNSLQNVYNDSGTATSGPAKIQEVDNTSTSSSYATTIGASTSGNMLIAIVGMHPSPYRALRTVQVTLGRKPTRGITREATQGMRSGTRTIRRLQLQ
jgi:hypothetical protein